MVAWHLWLNGHKFEQEIVKNREAGYAAVHGVQRVRHDLATNNSMSYLDFLFVLISPFFACVFRLSYVNHAEDLASKLLQCSPKNRLSAQAALSHEYFSDLPPRLWELTDSEYDKFGTSNWSRGMILASMCNIHVEGFTCLCFRNIMCVYVNICITRVCVYVGVYTKRERWNGGREVVCICI